MNAAARREDLTTHSKPWELHWEPREGNALAIRSGILTVVTATGYYDGGSDEQEQALAFACRAVNEYGPLVAERDRYRDALEQIAYSYEWIAFEDDETLPNAGHESITPTNRRIAREALAGSGGDTTNG